MSSSDPPPPPSGALLVRTSGFCVACDSRFRNQLAYRVPAAESADGFVLIEARHYSAVIRPVVLA